MEQRVHPRHRVGRAGDGAAGLNQWKASVQEKLCTLNDIYRFAVEQTSMARGEFLELVVVVILVLELVLLITGAMRI